MSLTLFLTIVLFLLLVLFIVRYVIPIVKDKPDRKEIERLKRESQVFREIAGRHSR